MDIITLAIIFIIGICIGGISTYFITKTSKAEQLIKIKEWLIFAVSDAEKYLEGEEGALKLRAVYDEFIKRYPKASTWVTFETFSTLVDEALEKYKTIIQ